MSNPSRRPHALPMLLVAALVAVLGYRSVASKPDPQPDQQATGSCKIATFDLEKTFNTIDQKKAADAELMTLAKEMNAEGEAAHKAIRQLEADLKEHLPGTPQFKEIETRYLEASYQYRALLEFDKAKIDIRRARTLKRIYADIRSAVAALAEERGYAVVFVDDSVNEIPAGSEEETNRQISARRMAYTSPEVDITEELISRMNKEFAASGAVVPPSAASVPSTSTNQP